MVQIFPEIEAWEAKMAADHVREKALSDYRKKLMEHKEVVKFLMIFWWSFKLTFPKVDARLKDLRNQLKDLTTAYAKSEDDLKVMFWWLWP